MRKIPTTIRKLLTEQGFDFEEDHIVNMLFVRYSDIKDVPAPSWKGLRADTGHYWLALEPDSHWLDWEFDLNQCALMGAPPAFVGIQGERLFVLPNLEDARKDFDKQREEERADS